MGNALEVHPEGKEVAIAQSSREEGVVNFQPLQGANPEPASAPWAPPKAFRIRTAERPTRRKAPHPRAAARTAAGEALSLQKREIFS